ncbi:MAG TPA: SH3 domain-containing protein [Steroidobacteraceae bacterium]|nr:SH3 domain-containing protein [Steroidobacteraceae bacterium]
MRALHRAGSPHPSAPGRVLLALLLATPAAAPAESLYVIEQLVVGVSSAADASGERVATLKSGDRVEVLERSGDAVHVRLASGRDGWVRASYLSADEPLRVRLAQRDAELARLGNELSALKAQLAARPAATAAAPVAATPVSLEAARAAAVPPAGALFSTEEERPRALWPRILAASLIAFGFGFALGALLLDRHIRRKYGGLRIY